MNQVIEIEKIIEDLADKKATPVIVNKLQRVKRILTPCENSHKYMRFSKKNKTYFTDRYYCCDCGKTVLIALIFGHKTKCWKCNRIFSIKAGDTRMKFTCEEC